MDKSDLNIILKQFTRASDRLAEALKEDINQNPLALDGTIQRFEFCFELCWKMLKRFLEYKGIFVKSPRDALQESLKLGWLTEGDSFWSEMLEDRNLTAHTYHEKTIQELYSRIPVYSQSFKRLKSTLEQVL